MKKEAGKVSDIRHMEDAVRSYVSKQFGRIAIISESQGRLTKSGGTLTVPVHNKITGQRECIKFAISSSGAISAKKAVACPIPKKHTK